MPVSAQNVLIQPASGRAVSFFGNRAIFKVRGDQTSGAFSITEVVLAPSGTLVPPHRHEKMAEVSYRTGIPGWPRFIRHQTQGRAARSVEYVGPAGQDPRDLHARRIRRLG